MEIIKTAIDDLVILKPKVWGDDRGYFFESYNRTILETNGLIYDWVQDNESFSSFGVIRGLHFQNSPMGQAKLVRVIKGAVLDVAVDLRPNSSTFGMHLSFELTADNKHQLLIPRGFAHGFSVLSKEAIFCYKCDNYYSPEHDGGIRFNDQELNIDWQIPVEKQIVSDKDQQLPFLHEFKNR